MNLFVKDTNHFLRKTKSLCQLPEGTALCTIDVAGLYLSILHDESLASLRRFLDGRKKKKVKTKNLVELAEVIFKNDIFQYNENLKTVKRYSN